MRLLDRYLFRELFAPLVYCLGGFMIFFISWQLYSDLDRLQAARLHFLDVVEYAVSVSPEFLVAALPVALLLALLYTLTYLGRHNEITAMRAAGVSLWRISAPYFVVGFFASLALFALNEFCVPQSNDWSEQILNRYTPKAVMKTSDTDATDALAFQNDRAHRTWFFRQFHVRTGELEGVIVMTNGWRLEADRAVYTNGLWEFFHVAEYIQREPTATFSPLLQTNALAMTQFHETPREMQIEIKINKGEQTFTRKNIVSLRDILDYLRLRPGVQSGWVLTQLHQRLAAPWTCLVVVLIAIPFGAASGRRNLFFGVAGSIFICFLYFVIQRVSFSLGDGGHLPGWLAAWLPNVIFAVAGIILTARVR